METVKLLALIPAIALAIFLSACVDTDKGTPTNPQTPISKPSGRIISKIEWVGNQIHSDEELSELLGIKVGDRYNRQAFTDKLFGYPGAESVVSLYMNNGYLFFNTDIKEKVTGNSVELALQVAEGEQVWVNRVTLTGKNGNAALAEKVKPLLDVKNGQLFNRSALFSSQENIARSGLVNPDSVTIMPYPLANAGINEKKYVDIAFEVQNP